MNHKLHIYDVGQKSWREMYLREILNLEVNLNKSLFQSSCINQFVSNQLGIYCQLLETFFFNLPPSDVSRRL